jgi:AcrR family transcriptional regulator
MARPVNQIRTPSAEEKTTRERILAVAQRLFAEKGYTGVSTRAVAAEARCNLALIPYYFGSKEGLLEAAAGEKMAAVGERLRHLTAGDLPPAEQLERFIDFAVEFHQTNRQFMRLLFKVFLLEERELPKPLLTIVKRNLAEFARLIENLQKAGRCPKELNPRVVAFSIISASILYFVAKPLTVNVLGPISAKSTAEFKKTLKLIFVSALCTTPETRRSST